MRALLVDYFELGNILTGYHHPNLVANIINNSTLKGLGYTYDFLLTKYISKYFDNHGSS